MKAGDQAPVDRPHIQCGVIELESIALAAWDEAEVLREVCAELSKRSTARALSLRTRVTDRLRELGIAGASPVGPQGGPDAPRNEDGGGAPALRVSHLRMVELEEEVSRLSAVNKALRERLEAMTAADDFSSAGLAASCPDFLVEAAEKAYRRCWHPDMLIDQPPHRRAELASRLNEVLAALGRIRNARRGRDPD